MEVTVNGVAHIVSVSHYVGEFRNTAGESRKEVRATRLGSHETQTFDTYENPVTRQDLQEFLENRL